MDVWIWTSSVTRFQLIFYCFHSLRSFRGFHVEGWRCFGPKWRGGSPVRSNGKSARRSTLTHSLSRAIPARDANRLGQRPNQSVERVARGPPRLPARVCRVPASRSEPRTVAQKNRRAASDVLDLQMATPNGPYGFAAGGLVGALPGQGSLKRKCDAPPDDDNYMEIERNNYMEIEEQEVRAPGVIWICGVV